MGRNVGGGVGHRFKLYRRVHCVFIVSLLIVFTGNGNFLCPSFKWNLERKYRDKFYCWGKS